MSKEKFIKIIKDAAAIIVILSMFVIIFYQNRDRDIFKFDEETNDDSVSQTQESEGSYFIGDVRKIGDEVAYINTTSYNIYDANAETKRVDISLSEPVLHTDSDYAVCYNKASLDASVYKRDKECYSVKSTENILVAKVNKNGYLFLATEKEGYNCECIVYNSRGEAVFKWNISKSEFLDGDISGSNNTIVLSLATAGDQKLLGEIELIDITQADVIAKEPFDSQVFYSVDFNSNNTFVALGSHNLKYFNSNGSEKWSYDYKGKTLSKADVSNPDFMVLAFEKSGSGIKGNSTDVRVVNRLGKQTANKTYDYIADGISVGESSVAIAFGKEVYICDIDLDTEKKVLSESGVKKLTLFNDDEHVFVINSSGKEILE